MLSRLRSSTAVSESKPSCLNARSGWMAPPVAWPRTTAALTHTSSSSARARSASGRAASRRAGAGPSSVPVAATVRLAPAPTSRRSNGGTEPDWKAVRAAATSSFIATSWSRSERRAALNIARPSVSDSGLTPERRNLARSVASRWPVMPLARSHRPQAIDRPGSPSVRRRRASASRKALAAA